MSIILKFDLKKSGENHLNYMYKKKHNFACDNYIFPKQGETRTSSGTISQPLNENITLR